MVVDWGRDGLGPGTAMAMRYVIRDGGGHSHKLTSLSRPARLAAACEWACESAHLWPTLSDSPQPIVPPGSHQGLTAQPRRMCDCPCVSSHVP